jgi:hypothetical protein
MFTVTAMLILWMCVGFLWWMYFFLYRNHRVDVLRHRLFVVRNDLFLAASRGEIAFDHPAYLMTRKTLNGSIRFAHQLSMTQLLMSRLFIGDDMPSIRADYERRRAKAYQGLSSEQIKLLRGCERSMHAAMMSHVAHISPLLFPVALVLKLVIKTGLLDKLESRGQETFANVDALTYKYGDAAVA